jgi:putative DNA methylase
MEAYAGDLNPVAVLLNRCYLELVPRWDGCPPVNPADRAKIGGKQGWRGAAGLAADVRYYGRVILERARERIGHLYPPARVTVEMAAEHPHLQGYIGKDLPVIAWLWARTVPSPDPAARGPRCP